MITYHKQTSWHLSRSTLPVRGYGNKVTIPLQYEFKSTLQGDRTTDSFLRPIKTPHSIGEGLNTTEEGESHFLTLWTIITTKYNLDFLKNWLKSWPLLYYLRFESNKNQTSVLTHSLNWNKNDALLHKWHFKLFWIQMWIQTNAN